MVERRNLKDHRPDDNQDWDEALYQRYLAALELARMSARAFHEEVSIRNRRGSITFDEYIDQSIDDRAKLDAHKGNYYDSKGRRIK